MIKSEECSCIINNILKYNDDIHCNDASYYNSVFKQVFVNIYNIHKKKNQYMWWKFMFAWIEQMKRKNFHCFSI